MKIRLKSKIFSLISILAFHFVLGCSDSISDSSPAPTSSATGVVKIALGLDERSVVLSSARSALPSSFSNSSGDPLVFAAAVTSGATPSDSDLVSAALGASNTLEIPFKLSTTARNDYHLNIYAYPDGTSTFTTASALLHGSARISIGANETVVTLASPVKMYKTETATEKGFVDLKIKIPADYTLSCDSEIGLDIALSETSGGYSTYTLKTTSTGTESKEHTATFKIQKDSETVYAWTETIHVYPALTTNRWNTGEVADTERKTRLLPSVPVKSTFYVRGTGSTWFDAFDSTDGDDTTGNGSIAKPYATIQKAVDAIKAINDGTTEYKIYVDGTVSGSTSISVTTATKISIEGLGTGSNIATLDGNNEGSVITASGTDLELTLKKLKITKGNAEKGGGIKNSATLNIADCEISGNTATGSGGGIYNTGTLTFSGNIAINANDEVYLETGKFITITGDLTGTAPVATITPASYTAGTVVLKGATEELLTDNISKFALSDPNYFIIQDSSTPTNAIIGINTIYLNTSGDDSKNGLTAATAVKTLTKAMSLLDCTKPNPKIIVLSSYTLPNGEEGVLNRASVTGNKVTIERGFASGDIMTISSGEVTISNVTLDGRKDTYTTNYGVLLKINSGVTVTLGEGAVLQNNLSRDDWGGAIFNYGTLKITGSTAKIIGNQGGFGGAIANYEGKIEISAGTIEANIATSNGGGIYSSDYSNNNQGVTVTGGSIIGNHAKLGGGICTDKKLIITGGTISDNTVSEKGSGIYYGNGTLEMSGAVQIADNNDVYLASGTYITITGGLTGTAPVATITPASYTSGTVVLKADDAALIASNYEKFDLTPDGSTPWMITSDGKLAEVVTWFVKNGGNDSGLAEGRPSNINTVLNTIINTNNSATNPKAYTIIVDGSGGEISANYQKPVADFNNSNKKLILTIEGKNNAILKGTNTSVISTDDEGNGANSEYGTKKSILLTLKNLTLTNGVATSDGKTYGGGIKFYGDENSILILDNCVLTKNTALYGGAMMINGGNVVLQNGTVIGNKDATTAPNDKNTAINNGGNVSTGANEANTAGGITLYAPNNDDSITLTIKEGCYVSGNYCATDSDSGDNKTTGGILVQARTTLNVEEGTFIQYNNAKGGTGGGIGNIDGTVNLTGGTIKGNTASQGKEIHTNNSNVKLSGSVEIDTNNDVYLASGKYLTVTGALTGTSTVARITPPSYTEGTQVLQSGGNLTELTEDICDKFTVTSQGDSNTISSSRIVALDSDNTKGVIKVKTTP